MLVRGKTPNARDERVHRGRERPPKPRRGFGPQTGGENGVAPGHETVFAAYSFWWCSIGCSLVYKCLAFPSAERDPERDAERSSENPVPRFMPDSLPKMS
jgi:hypothetical protein